MLVQLHFTVMFYAVTMCETSVVHLTMRSTYHGMRLKKSLGKNLRSTHQSKEPAFSSCQSALASAILQETNVTTGQYHCESKSTAGYINLLEIVTIDVIEKMVLKVSDHITLTEVFQEKKKRKKIS